MDTKSGYVTIIGKPNVGKSTLMNALMGERLSIISNKPQTTRKRVLGILSDDNYQIIFLDTPGILTPGYLLQEKFVEYIEMSIKDADIILVMIDIVADKTGELTFNDELVKKVLNMHGIIKIAVINKIDKSQEAEVNQLYKKIEEMNIFNSIIPLSATKKFNLQKVINDIVENLPLGPKYYPDDQITDEPERFFVSEIIREKIFEQYKEEIPFSTEVVIDEFKERETGKDYIAASIIVERDSQKPIIIGKQGEAIKRLGQIAREAVELFLQRPVYIELNVKVKNKWRRNPQMLKNFGYNTDND
ncbi:MAG: GTPase Era [Bacteroidetes bacterium]|nr:GTPase Era [Bacteroidota bacterium]